MGIRAWLTELQRPLYRNIVSVEERIALRDEAKHRLRANKLRAKAGMEPLGGSQESKPRITGEDMRAIYASKQTPSEAVAEFHREMGQ